MRITGIAIVAMVVSACATGPSVGSVSEFQQITASQIGGDIKPDDIRIENRRALILTSYWTATTPAGAVYECSRDLNEDRCELQVR